MAQNTEQIIKGLEESVKKIEAHYDARNIPKDKRPSENKKALKLIKDLLAENRGLNTALETLRGVVEDYEHHNENLVKENKHLRKRLAEEMEHAKDMAVADTLKEIVEYCQYKSYTLGRVKVVGLSAVEEKAKEILEGT